MSQTKLSFMISTKLCSVPRIFDGKSKVGNLLKCAFWWEHTSFAPENGRVSLPGITEPPFEHMKFATGQAAVFGKSVCMANKHEFDEKTSILSKYSFFSLSGNPENAVWTISKSSNNLFFAFLVSKLEVLAFAVWIPESLLLYSITIGPY